MSTGVVTRMPGRLLRGISGSATQNSIALSPYPAPRVVDAGNRRSGVTGRLKTTFLRQEPGRRPTPAFRRGRCLGVLAALCLWVPHPAAAQVPVELRLCPPTVVRTCYVGYLTSASKVVVLISSIDNDPLVGTEVEVAATAPSETVHLLDLSPHVGSVVMLDAVGDDRVYSARLVSVATPLVTTLYMSMFLQPLPDGAAPR
jgi:hypothetical protein